MRASLCVSLIVLLAAPVAHAKAQMAVSGEDRGILADLAPPSDRATARGTYGDAVFAHGERAPRRLTRRRPCTAADARCGDSASAFFRRNYVFTPSYVSAPQVFQPSPSGRSNLLSPITSFFLNPFDQPNPADVP